MYNGVLLYIVFLFFVFLFLFLFVRFVRFLPPDTPDPLFLIFFVDVGGSVEVIEGNLGTFGNPSKLKYFFQNI